MCFNSRPSRPLISQWAADVSEFGLDPVVLTGLDPVARRKEFERLSIAFGTAQPRAEVLIND